MSSEVLVPQVTLDNEEGYSLTATGDDVAISVRNVGDRPQDRLKQAFLWGRKKLYREFWALRDVLCVKGVCHRPTLPGQARELRCREVREVVVVNGVARV